MAEKIYIKKVEVVDSITKQQKMMYGLYDSMGFIFSAEPTLNKAIDYCYKNKCEYEVVEGV